MTKKIHCQLLREAFPQAAQETLASLAEVNRSTFRFHTMPSFRDRRNRWNRGPHGWQKKRTTAVKAMLIAELGGKCIKCGYSKCVGALDFHHRDQGGKENAISDLLLGNYERALAEARKCDLLCCRCHRELHYENETLGPND